MCLLSDSLVQLCVNTASFQQICSCAQPSWLNFVHLLCSPEQHEKASWVSRQRFPCDTLAWLESWSWISTLEHNPNVCHQIMKIKQYLMLLLLWPSWIPANFRDPIFRTDPAVILFTEWRLLQLVVRHRKGFNVCFAIY